MIVRMFWVDIQLLIIVIYVTMTLLTIALTIAWAFGVVMHLLMIVVFALMAHLAMNRIVIKMTVAFVLVVVRMNKVVDVSYLPLKNTGLMKTVMDLAQENSKYIVTQIYLLIGLIMMQILNPTVQIQIQAHS